jgi:hypothetical protein
VELLRGVVGTEEIYAPSSGGLGYRGFLIRGVEVGERPSDFKCSVYKTSCQTTVDTDNRRAQSGTSVRPC